MSLRAVHDNLTRYTHTVCIKQGTHLAECGIMKMQVAVFSYDVFFEQTEKNNNTGTFDGIYSILFYG